MIHDQAATNVQLGADGHLPELHLQEVAKKEVEEIDTAPKKPLLVIGALVASFVMSIGLLLIDTSEKKTEPATKDAARAAVAKHYLSPPAKGELKPYQKLLREALQAHNRKDYATERRRYRQVLNLLRAENNSDTRGLTGLRSSKVEPNDKMLEDHLSNLLAE